MRIKKYQNWKFTNTQISSLFSVNQSKNTELFSVSQLLETPKKHILRQDEHRQYIFTDPTMNNNYFNLNRRILTKKQVRIPQLVKSNQKTEREQTIKNKIKKRLKQEYSNDELNQTNHKELQRDETTHVSTPSRQTKRRPVQRQNQVYIRGNSVTFNAQNYQQRNKSSILRTSLPNFNSKQKLSRLQKLHSTQNWQRPKFFSVQMKRKKSQGFQQHSKSNSFVVKKHSLKDIQPWQFDLAHEGFDI